jgi:diamine N-acetyltransferase
LVDKNSIVSLREITRDTVDVILNLAVHRDQERFVANNAKSIAQAHFTPNAWFRAVYADETPVGFVMLYIDVPTDEYYIWRFMIDVRHQGKGYGEQAMKLLVRHIQDTYPAAKAVTLSYVPAEGSPEHFYKKFGFENTGEVDEGENIMRLDLPPKW